CFLCFALLSLRSLLLFLWIGPPPGSTLFPYTTLFRSHRPRWRAGGSLEWRATDRLDVRLRHAFTDKRYDFANPTGLKALDPSHRSEEHTSELQSRENLVCRLLLEKKKIIRNIHKLSTC